MMESFFLEFDSQPSCAVRAGRGFKKVVSVYEKEFLPLALELYTHHVQSSDLVLLNSLLSFNNAAPSSNDVLAGAAGSGHQGRDAS